MVTSAGLLAAPAQASTSEVTSFAQAAFVTQWTLPPVSPKVGAMPEPAFARPQADEGGPEGGFRPSSALLAATSPAEPTGEHSSPAQWPTAEAGADRPILQAEDLEARRVGTYDRQQPYRTPGDIKALEVAFQVLNVADAVTTVVCLSRDNCHENNPIYGKHPKPIVVVGAKAAVGIVHYLAMRSLLPDNPGLARALGWVSVAIQGTVVGLNVSQLF